MAHQGFHGGPKRTKAAPAIIALLSATLLAPGCGAEKRNLGTARIMPLGDSITQGDADHTSYRRPLWEKLRDAGYSVDFVGSLQTNYKGPNPEPGFDLDHEGHWGWRADQILANIGPWAREYKPDVALVHLGSNDLFQRQGVEDTIGELDRIIDALRAANPHIIVLLSQLIPIDAGMFTKTYGMPVDPRWKMIHTGFNKAIVELGKEKSTEDSPVQVVDMPAGFDATSMTYDGVHPNAKGEELMAEKWFDALARILAK